MPFDILVFLDYGEYLMKDQKLKAKFNAYNARGTTALFRAVESGDLVKTVHLLREGADADIVSREPRGVFGMVYNVPYPPGSTPLHVAALAGNFALTEILIRLGHADPHRQNDRGETPLDAALTNLAYYEQRLAKAGSRKSAALDQTVWMYEKTIELLIDAGARPSLFALPDRLAPLLSRKPGPQHP